MRVNLNGSNWNLTMYLVLKENYSIDMLPKIKKSDANNLIKNFSKMQNSKSKEVRFSSELNRINKFTINIWSNSINKLIKDIEELIEVIQDLILILLAIDKEPEILEPLLEEIITNMKTMKWIFLKIEDKVVGREDNEDNSDLEEDIKETIEITTTTIEDIKLKGIAWTISITHTIIEITEITETLATTTTTTETDSKETTKAELTDNLITTITTTIDKTDSKDKITIIILKDKTIKITSLYKMIKAFN